MTDIQALPPVVPAAPQAKKTAPALPPPLLAAGRGFTLAGWAAIVLVNGIFGITSNWGLGPVLDFLVMAVAGFLFVALFDGIATLLWKILGFILPRLRLGRLNDLLQAIPPAMVGRLIGILLMVFGNLLWPESIFQFATLVLPGKIIVLAAAVSGALFMVVQTAAHPPWRRYGVMVAVVPLVITLAWLFTPGTDGYLARPAAVAPAVAAPEFDNPALPGPFAVRSLAYGSGDNKHRDEFAANAALKTPVIDGSPIFAGYDGIPAAYYAWYNGFDFSRLPLNGLVWYPEGDGPFPLVLIVHGNHAMTEPSDPGYAYLGEHLASRGMIAVAVDENFLNGFGLDDPDMAEMPLRAWLLLKHLQQWRLWNDAPDNPFYGQVDLNRVGLIGHSRGGEAVSHAAEMNVRPIGRVGTVSKAEEFGFGIKGVVAIAPCDNRFKPAGRSLHLRNVDYLLLAAGHDGDMNYLDGLGQYSRTTFAENPDGFKALAYLYRGNHGNFNTVWGNADQGWFESLVLNRRPLLSAEEQQQAAKVFITGFLEASLNDQPAYRALFYNPSIAHNWLPDDIVVTQYQDAGFIALDSNERGSLAEMDLPGGRATTTGITVWRVANRTLRDGQTTVPNRGLLLEWENGAAPTYALELPSGAAAEWGLTPDHALSFTLASMMAEGTPGTVTLELETHDGTTARLPLDAFGSLPPALPAKLTKASWIDGMPGIELTTAAPFERVDQTFDLPLAAFVAANAVFRPQELTTIRFLFDGGIDGKLMIDDIGFRVPATQTE